MQLLHKCILIYLMKNEIIQKEFNDCPSNIVNFQLNKQRVFGYSGRLPAANILATQKLILVTFR